MSNPAMKLSGRAANHIRKTKADRTFDIIIYTIAVIMTLLALYPMYFIVIASISDPNQVAQGNVLLWPQGFSMEGYSYLFSMGNLWRGYLNGGGLIPTFIILNNTFNMVDTFLVMVLPFSVISYYIVVSRTFFQTSLPADLWDAAQIDGCGNLRYFFQVVLPLSKAILAVIALWAAVGHWNSYFNAMIYLRTPEKYPLQLVMRNILINNEMAASAMTGSAAADINRKANLIKYGAIVVSSLPIMTMYPFVQKYFNQGVMIGALKG